MDKKLKTKKEVASIIGVDRKTLYLKEQSKNIEPTRCRLNIFEAQKRIDMFELTDEAFKIKYNDPEIPHSYP
jgi:DNA-binding XRE family transcriptional regulator